MVTSADPLGVHFGLFRCFSEYYCNCYVVNLFSELPSRRFSSITLEAILNPSIFGLGHSFFILCCPIASAYIYFRTLH